MTGRRMASGRLSIRDSRAEDREAIGKVENLAYRRTEVADLSRAMILAPVDTISLVAVIDDTVIGHVLLTRIEGPDRALALAPLAVGPAWRDMQIGTELVRAALDRARSDGWRCVFVLGMPDFYGRFGFLSRLADCAEIEWQGPRFLALALVPGAFDGWQGPLVYPEPFRIIG